MRDPRDIIKRPVITERSSDLIEGENKYTFIVDKKANKIEIKEAVEKLFDVTVLKVNTMNVKPKKRRVGRYEGYRSGYKKAVVQLVEGDIIELFEV